MNDRYIALIHEIRCPKCLNESIADSSAPVAADLRREVRRLMGEGKSDADIKDYLSARYGDFVLYRPRVSEVTWALWAGPFVFLVIGGVVFLYLLAMKIFPQMAIWELTEGQLLTKHKSIVKSHVVVIGKPD